MNHNTDHRAQLAGQTFGKLTVLDFQGTVGLPRSRKAKWRCRCACGVFVIARADTLTRGLKTHCGCLKPKPVRPKKPKTLPAVKRVYQKREKAPVVAVKPKPKPEPVKADPVHIARQMRQSGERWPGIAEYLECSVEEAKTLLAA